MNVLLFPLPQYGCIAWFTQSLLSLKLIVRKNHLDRGSAVMANGNPLFPDKLLGLLELIILVDVFKTLDRPGRSGCDFIDKVRHDWLSYSVAVISES